MYIRENLAAEDDLCSVLTCEPVDKQQNVVVVRTV